MEDKIKEGRVSQASDHGGLDSRMTVEEVSQPDSLEPDRAGSAGHSVPRGLSRCYMSQAVNIKYGGNRKHSIKSVIAPLCIETRSRLRGGELGFRRQG